jgi:hypothetical protein
MAMGMLERIASEKVPGLQFMLDVNLQKNDSSPAVYVKLCLYYCRN